MHSSKKVLIISPNQSYVKMFRDNGWEVLLSPYKDVPDLVLFTGGEDVNPHLYGEVPHPYTGYNPARDMKEKQLFKEILEMNIPMVGICRGGQFLNVMNGGKMYQHCSNHTVDHLIKDVKNGDTLIATSTHHQMMRPTKEAIILATANNGGFKEHMILDTVNKVVDDPVDVEVAYYPHTCCLCFQPHPEFGSEKLKEYFFKLVNTYLL